MEECIYCGKNFEPRDRKWIQDSGYMHEWCYDFTHPALITPAMVREKWYNTHPELWNDTTEETLD